MPPGLITIPAAPRRCRDVFCETSRLQSKASTSFELSQFRYAIVEDGGQQLSVGSAAFDPNNGSVTLTTKEALKPDTVYTISTRNLTDLANHPLVDPKASLRTWDDNPKGIKVFILSGQSNMVGYGGEASPPPYESYHAVEKAQLWVSGVGKPANVLSHDTRGDYEPPETSRRNQGFHWNGSARSYFRVGKGLGEDMLKLLTR